MPENNKVISFPIYSNVIVHHKCYDEVIGIVHHDEIPQFIAAYEDRVAYLSQNLGREIDHRSWFEVLKKAHGLRAIRFMNFRNLRILYVIEDNKAILLLAFEERKGHKKTEYAGFIEPAFERLIEEKQK